MKTSCRRYRTSLAGFISALLVAVSADAATLTVNSAADAGGTCPGTTCTLRQAIAMAASGDTINFAAGITTITLTSGELLINQAVTINGPGPKLLTVQRDPAAANFRIFDTAFVSLFSNITISGLTISNGSSTAGGGIYASRETLAITNCIISGNTAATGGGLYTDPNAQVTITNCTFSGNTATNGGGIYNVQSNTVTLTNCTISGNSATGGVGGSSNGGGGVYNGSGTALTLTNSTVFGNTTGSVGGGVWNFGTATLTHSTISGNSATQGGGGIFNLKTVNLSNTIVAKNNGTPSNRDINGSCSSQGYNLIGEAGSSGLANGTNNDQVGSAAAPIDPKLDTLKDNGGATFTQALLAGSTAIDKGSASATTTDQRGFARPVVAQGTVLPSGGDGSDIGAYEVQADQLAGCSEINRVVNTNNDSVTGSLRSVIASACTGSTITFAPDVRGAISLTSGELLINKGLTINGPGANLLSIQRSSAAGTPNFRIFHMNGNFNVSISGLTIAKGFFPGNLGGGISNDNGTLILDSVTVSGNTADIGAGIYTGRAATITNSTISGNTVSGNIAGDGGGAIYNQGGTLNLTNSTLASNFAQTAGGGGQGGGIRNNLGTVSILNSTIAGNTADQGGGIYHSNGGGVTVQNSIIAQNTSASGPDLNGTFTSSGFNLIGNSSASSGFTNGTNNDQVGSATSPINPLLGSLLDNGGPTFTRALLSGSPAIDKGKTNNSSTDQRGFPRPIDFSGIANATNGDGSDIGAFEVQPATTLANISTRLRVETGDNVLIGGFIVTGTQPKKIIVRAIGPSLPFADKLADPILELHDSSGALLETNDNWMDSPNKQAIIDSTIPPNNPLESAIVRSVSPGNYTAIERGVNDGTGIGVVEAYDLDTSANSKLANISTRGLVQTGDNVLFAGTIVVGQASQKVIIRALGPSTGVPGAMADPTLELHDGKRRHCWKRTITGSIARTNKRSSTAPSRHRITRNQRSCGR